MTSKEMKDGEPEMKRDQQKKSMRGRGFRRESKKEVQKGNGK